MKTKVLSVLGLSLSLLAVGCGGSNPSGNGGAGGPGVQGAALVGGTVQAAQYNENPVTVSFQAMANQRYDIQGCISNSACDIYVSIDCSRGPCVVYDDQGNIRTNYRLSVSSQNGPATVTMTDLVYTAFGAVAKMQVRAGGGAWVDMVKNASLQPVPPTAQ